MLLVVRRRDEVAPWDWSDCSLSSMIRALIQILIVLILIHHTTFKTSTSQQYKGCSHGNISFRFGWKIFCAVENIQLCSDWLPADLSIIPLIPAPHWSMQVWKDFSCDWILGAEFKYFSRYGQMKDQWYRKLGCLTSSFNQWKPMADAFQILLIKFNFLINIIFICIILSQIILVLM